MLTYRVVPVAPVPVLPVATTDVTVAGLDKVSPEVLAEVISQEFLLYMLDDREETPVGFVEGQLRVCVPSGRIPAVPTAPGQRFAHLRRIVVHRLEIDPGRSGRPVSRPPRRGLSSRTASVRAVCGFRCLQREGHGAAPDASALRGRNTPGGRPIGMPHVESRPVAGFTGSAETPRPRRNPATRSSACPRRRIPASPAGAS